jgi:DNA-binding NarL/FixJ family response regulator
MRIAWEGQRKPESTVKVHVTHILEKLKVTGRTEAINVALKRGLVHMDQTEAA